jgi:hypothetical protein
MIPFTRILTMLMFGVLCLVLIVPIALQRHNTAIAVGIPVVFAIYLAANVVLWRRMKQHS